MGFSKPFVSQCFRSEAPRRQCEDTYNSTDNTGNTFGEKRSLVPYILGTQSSSVNVTDVRFHAKFQ